MTDPAPRSHSVNFDRAAQFYDETRGFPPDIEAPAAALIASTGELNKQSRVLEIGIGTGRIALPLAAHVGSIHGADISGDMLARLLQKRGHLPVFPTVGDAEMLPYPANSFDAVVVVHVFHLVRNLAAVVDELRRVLKPEAPLIHCWNSEDNPLDKLRRDSEAHVNSNISRRWRRGDDYLLESGWTTRKAEDLEYTQYKIPARGLELYRQRAWSSTWELSDEDHARGITYMEEQIARHFEDPNAPVPALSRFHVHVYQQPARS